MTQMSEMHDDRAPASRANYPHFLGGSGVARWVQDQGVLVGVLASLLLIGCVIPPSLEVDKQDAGVNSPPAILSVTSDQQALPEPGPVLFAQGRTAGTLSLSLIDTDVSDTLYVRIFVDYNTPNRLDARVRCAALPGGDPMRSASCILSTLCTDDDLGVQRNMTVVVFDRQPLEGGQDPPFQAMPEGGLSTSRFYFLKCQPASS
jgi:hypothetical protein